MAVSGRVLLVLALLVLSMPVRAGLVINECLPDPSGPDAGQEFVEILNTDIQVVMLEGVRLEFANGADGIWQVRWSGGVGEVLEPGHRLLVVDRGWAGSPLADHEVVLGLQNGPDAVRLVRGVEVLDLLGYGTGLASGLAETAAVPVTTGLALARRPDGRDTGDNSRDFRAAPPTPGAVNFQQWSLAGDELVCEPPSLAAPGFPLRMTVRVRNDGWGAWPPGRISCRLGGQWREVPWPGCLPDSTVSVVWDAVPRETGALTVVLEVPADVEVPGWSMVAGICQVGPGILILQEVMAAPGDHQGEWIELQALQECNLAAYRLRDADGDWRTLPAHGLAPGERVVLADDAKALLAREEVAAPFLPCRLTTHGVLELSGWPSLNNTVPAGRDWADRVLLADSAGTVLDHVTLGEPGREVPAGRSWERAAVHPPDATGWNWGVSRSLAGGTPGCPNSLAAPVDGFAGGLDPVPRVLDPAAGVAVIHIRARVPVGAAYWRVEIYDLWGAAVRTWSGDEWGGGLRDLPWSGEDDQGRSLPAGAYIVLLATTDGTGRPLGRERALLVVR